MIKTYGLSREEFDELIDAYIDTLLRNKDHLYDFYIDKTIDLTISFPLKVGEIPTMEVNCNKIVYEENDKEIIEIEGEK